MKFLPVPFFLRTCIYNIWRVLWFRSWKKQTLPVVNRKQTKPTESQYSPEASFLHTNLIYVIANFKYSYVNSTDFAMENLLWYDIYLGKYFKGTWTRLVKVVLFCFVFLMRSLFTISFFPKLLYISSLNSIYFKIICIIHTYMINAGIGFDNKNMNLILSHQQYEAIFKRNDHFQTSCACNRPTGCSWRKRR